MCLHAACLLFPWCCPEIPPCPCCRKLTRVLLTENCFSQSFKLSRKIFKISFHHNQLDDNTYLSDQLPHIYAVYPAQAVGGWDCCRKQRTLHQCKSAQLSWLARPSADSCQLSLCLRLLWLILFWNKQRVPKLQAESHLLWRWEWGGFCVTPSPPQEGVPGRRLSLPQLTSSQSSKNNSGRNEKGLWEQDPPFSCLL